MDHWLGVEFRHLAALEAIDAERSFRGAADRLGYVQSAVSQQISSLERIVGTRLVERSPGKAGLELTRPGVVLREHTDRIIAQLNAARADLDALSAGAGDALRVGTFQSVATRVMPEVLARLASRRPGLSVVATEAASDADLFGRVEQGELDVAFAELPLAPGPFEWREVLVDPCVLVVHSSSSLADRGRPPTLDEVAALPLALPNWRMAAVIEHQLSAAGLAPDRCFRLETNTAVQALAAAGVAAAVLPRLAVDVSMPDTQVIDLDGLLPDRRIVLYWHGERIHRPALEVFAETVARVCGRFGSSPAEGALQALPAAA